MHNCIPGINITSDKPVMRMRKKEVDYIGGGDNDAYGKNENSSANKPFPFRKRAFQLCTDRLQTHATPFLLIPIDCIY